MENKGWIHQFIKDKGREPTTEELRKELEKIFYRRETEVTDRRVIVYQECLTYGWVSRGGDEDRICNDPQCGSCRMWGKGEDMIAWCEPCVEKYESELYRNEKEDETPVEDVLKQMFYSKSFKK